MGIRSDREMAATFFRNIQEVIASVVAALIPDFLTLEVQDDLAGLFESDGLKTDGYVVDVGHRIEFCVNFQEGETKIALWFNFPSLAYPELLLEKRWEIPERASHPAIPTSRCRGYRAV